MNRIRTQTIETRPEPRTRKVHFHHNCNLVYKVHWNSVETFWLADAVYGDALFILAKCALGNLNGKFSMINSFARHKIQFDFQNIFIASIPITQLLNLHHHIVHTQLRQMAETTDDMMMLMMMKTTIAMYETNSFRWNDSQWEHKFSKSKKLLNCVRCAWNEWKTPKNGSSLSSLSNQLAQWVRCTSATTDRINSSEIKNSLNSSRFVVVAVAMMLTL